MRRVLLPSSVFERQARRLAGKNPTAATQLAEALRILAEDAFDPRLKTHKLKGKLAGCWACSGGYDLRILFEFVKSGDSPAILLLNVGTHDDVY